jgi:hypothetical protein
VWTLVSDRCGVGGDSGEYDADDNNSESDDDKGDKRLAKSEGQHGGDGPLGRDDGGNYADLAHAK